MLRNSQKFFCIPIILLLITVVFSMFGNIYAETNFSIPDINISVSSAEGDFKIADSIQIIILLTVLTLAPSILIMMTSFSRFVIVLGFIRRALSLQSTPPNQTLIGLALFMTLFVMQPVFSDIYDNAYLPMQQGEITADAAYEKAIEPLETFMLRQVRSKDLALFLNIAGVSYQDGDRVPLQALIPAFIISELKLAFEIGFLIFLPFIVIDMIVSSTLMALGMMMLPPVMISLPIKILLFLLVDGWNIIVEKLVLSIR